jgi:small subunit ribosomal protein S18
MSADRFDRFAEREERGDRGGSVDRNNAFAEDDRRGGGRGGFRRRKVCRFCSEKDATIDYRDAGNLKFFISERGKVVPRRISGNCAKHQREMAVAIKRSRALALIPYAITG